MTRQHSVQDAHTTYSQPPTSSRPLRCLSSSSYCTRGLQAGGTRTDIRLTNNAAAAAKPQCSHSMSLFLCPPLTVSLSSSFFLVNSLVLSPKCLSCVSVGVCVCEFGQIEVRWSTLEIALSGHCSYTGYYNRNRWANDILWNTKLKLHSSGIVIFI